jgi:hypothetical protein
VTVKHPGFALIAQADFQNRLCLESSLKYSWDAFHAHPREANPVQGSSAFEYGSALPRIKEDKTIRVADEDAPEEYRGQQSILLRR